MSIAILIVALLTDVLSWALIVMVLWDMVSSAYWFQCAAINVQIWRIQRAESRKIKKLIRRFHGRN